MHGGKQSFQIRLTVEPIPIDRITVRPQLTLPPPVSKGAWRNTKESGRFLYAKEVLEIGGHSYVRFNVSNLTKLCNALWR
jgi:hypothetical protein